MICGEYDVGTNIASIVLSPHAEDKTYVDGDYHAVIYVQKGMFFNMVLGKEWMEIKAITTEDVGHICGITPSHIKINLFLQQ